MAQKKSDLSAKTNIRRIKANDDTPKKQSTKTTVKSESVSKDKVAGTKAKLNKVDKQPTKTVSQKNTKKKTNNPKNGSASFNKSTRNPFKALVNYFKGSWYELKQVRWPNRSATWSMTLAVLLFTAIFVVLIVLLDLGFNWVFEQFLK